MARDEVPDMLRDRDAFDIAAGSDFLGDLFRDVFGPVLHSVEGDDAYRIVELPRHEISDDGFDVRSFNLGFTVAAAFRSKSIDYEIDRLISPIRHYTPRQASSWHAHLQPGGTENQA